MKWAKRVNTQVEALIIDNVTVYTNYSMQLVETWVSSSDFNRQTNHSYEWMNNHLFNIPN